MPFAAESTLKLYEKIRTEEAQFPLLPSGKEPSPQLCSLLQGMLVKQPEQRMLMADVGAHEWTTQVDAGHAAAWLLPMHALAHFGAAARQALLWPCLAARLQPPVSRGLCCHGRSKSVAVASHHPCWCHACAAGSRCPCG